MDLTRVEPAQATLAYTDFLLATASLGSVRREVRGVEVLRMFRNLAPSHSRQGLARIGRLGESFH